MEAIGPIQVRVMHFLWKHGASTVHQVHDVLNAEPGAKPLAYTTILTVMRNLARRRFLSQTASGRAHRFAPLVDEDTYKRAMVKQLRDHLYGGNLRSFVSYFSQDDTVPDDLRQRLRDWLVTTP